mgnify:FL=1
MKYLVLLFHVIIDLSKRKVRMSKDLGKTVVYSALEVANVCGVANQTAINWIRNGYLKAFNTPGGQYRVYVDDLVAFMTERKMRIPRALMSNMKKKSCRILVVEDEIGLNHVIKTYLEKKIPEAELFQAFDGFEAGSLISSKKPDLIILDINLPGCNGIDLCKKIKNIEDFGEPYIFIVTAVQDKDLLDQLKSLNISCVFRKPLSLVDLLDSVQACFTPPPPFPPPTTQQSAIV